MFLWNEAGTPQVSNLVWCEFVCVFLSVCLLSVCPSVCLSVCLSVNVTRVRGLSKSSFRYICHTDISATQIYLPHRYICHTDISATQKYLPHRYPASQSRSSSYIIRIAPGLKHYLISNIERFSNKFFSIRNIEVYLPVLNKILLDLRIISSEQNKMAGHETQMRKVWNS